MEPTIYKPSIYKGAGIYNAGAEGGGGSYSIIQGTKFPTNDIGNDNDIYLLLDDYGGIKNDILQQSNNNKVIFSDQWTGEHGDAWHLFDHNNGTYWSTQLGNKTNQYCGIDLETPVVMKSCEIFPRVFSGHPQIQNFKIEASNNSTDWDVLYSGTIPDASSIVEFKFILNNNTPYRYYRLYVLDAYVSQTITVWEMFLSMSEDLDQNFVNHVYKKNNGVWDLVI